ncbi:MAG TPA: radical SAM protein, partial [Gemmatimonadales bacterium]
MHLYLHVPFCARRCSYCDFSIAVRKRIPAREYVDAIRRELAARFPAADDVLADGSTIYFGGGTPSLLPPAALADVLTHLLDVFPRRVSSTPLPDAAPRRFSLTPSLDVLEVTLEANPEDVTPATAESWRAAGVNRISLGAQSFDDRVLAWMHRLHSAERTREAVRVLRA